MVASGIPPARAALLIIIAAGAAYANSVANDFAYDDNTIISGNAVVTEGRWAESVTARLLTIEAGEGHHWQQWLWLGQAYANSGDPVRGLVALDSARIRTENPESVRQIDSISGTLKSGENATGSQNP